MYIVKLMIRRALRHHQAGNVDALLKFYSNDVRFVFPGKNSWAGEFQGKEAFHAESSRGLALVFGERFDLNSCQQ